MGKYMLTVSNHYHELYEIEIFDKTKDQINKIVKGKTIKGFKSKLNNIEKELKQSKIQVHEVKSIITKHAKNTIKDVKNANANVNVESNNILVNNFKAMIAEFSEKGFMDQALNLGNSILLLLVVLIINTFFMTIAFQLFGFSLGMIILAVLIAPITEEVSKYISIKRNHSGAFFIIFNAFEITTYVSQMLMLGVSAPVAIAVRLVAAFMHFFTTSIQRHYIDKKQDKIGVYLAIFIHGLWNLMAVT